MSASTAPEPRIRVLLVDVRELVDDAATSDGSEPRPRRCSRVAVGLDARVLVSSREPRAQRTSPRTDLEDRDRSSRSQGAADGVVPEPRVCRELWERQWPLRLAVAPSLKHWQAALRCVLGSRGRRDPLAGRS